MSDIVLVKSAAAAQYDTVKIGFLIQSNHTQAIKQNYLCKTMLQT